MRYRSEDFVLDTDAYSLTRNGINHPIEPQVFDLLVYLIDNRNRVVTREELLEKLWHGRIVSDSALNARLKVARKAVGDTGRRQSVIKTHHRRGYQFVADVSIAPEAVVHAAFPNALLPMASTKPSVAVLPFEHPNQDGDSDYFADGLTRDINANLCRYRELLVIDSNSVFEYRAGHSDAGNVTRELGVQYLARGNIRRSANRVRVSAQLLEVATGHVIWGDSLERAYEDIFRLEDEIASIVATKLAGHIRDESYAKAVRKPPDLMSAYDLVLNARQYEHSYGQDEVTVARGLLDKAIDLDPGYAATYAWLANTYVNEAETDWCKDPQEALKHAAALARKAVSLDGFDAYGHMVLGKAYMYLRRFDLAEVHLDRAIECNPNDYDAYCIKSWVLAFTGRGAEVATCSARALQLNPLVPDDCLAAITTAHYVDGKYDSALEMLEYIRDPSEQSEILRAACYAQLESTMEARRAAARAIELGGDYLQSKKWLDLWVFKHPDDREHFLDGLNKSGVFKSRTRDS